MDHFEIEIKLPADDGRPVDGTGAFYAGYSKNILFEYVGRGK
ncbi:MAG: hypothetical protein ACI4F1_07350 [Bariatricus sp.]